MRSLFAAVFTVALAGSAPASVIVNGSFESGTFSGGEFDTLGAGSPNLTGWTVGGNGIDWIGSYWQPSQGNRSVDLNALNTGSLSQTFATTAGVIYKVTFDMAGNPDGGPAVKTLTVGATGNAAQTYSFDTTGDSRPSMGWEGKTYFFTATGALTTLTFTSTTTANSGNSGFPFAFGPALDNVSVTATPEPVSLVLFGGLLVGGAAVVRRRMAKV
jgi:choice-of-anchor C domain-containing protein